MVSIRPAAPDDAAVIHGIQLSAFAEEARLSETRDIPPLTETVEAIERHVLSQTALVACDGERIVGSARGVVEGGVCTLRGVSVAQSHRGQGVGASLVRAVEGAHPGIRRFQLTTNSLVPGNVAFYERLGYRVDELTPAGGRIVLAQMSKGRAAG